MSYEFAIFLSLNGDAVQNILGFLGAMAMFVAALRFFVEDEHLAVPVFVAAAIAVVAVVMCGSHQTRKPVIDAAYGRIEVKE